VQPVLSEVEASLTASFGNLLSIVQKVQECEARDDDATTKDDKPKINL